MTKDQVVEVMIYTINNYNIELAEKAGATYEQIQNMIDGQRSALVYMCGLIYEDLLKNNMLTV